MIDVSRLSGSIIAVSLAVLAGCFAAQASQMDHLYRAHIVVSGQGETNRIAGFGQCFRDVLVKLSGDQRLLDDPRVPPLASNAAELVSGFSYRDLLSGVPIHDEQGSYDRPHDLTVEFDPAKFDAVLEQLDREPWLSQRPQIAVALQVEPRNGPPFMLASDSTGVTEADMRTALGAAAEKVGLTIALPLLAETGGQQTADDGKVLLSGKLAWSDEARGWIADWNIDAQQKAHQWQVRGVGFDDAFRNGLRGAAQVLSGNGEPASS